VGGLCYANATARYAPKCHSLSAARSGVMQFCCTPYTSTLSSGSNKRVKNGVTFLQGAQISLQIAFIWEWQQNSFKTNLFLSHFLKVLMIFKIYNQTH
jgi:hypothetical protein